MVPVQTLNSISEAKVETLREQVKQMSDERIDRMIRLCSEELLRRLHENRRMRERAELAASRLRFPDHMGQ